jgi:hypothetical protein
VPIDEGADIGFELLDRGMNTSTEPFSGEFGKLALDLIEYRALRGLEHRSLRLARLQLTVVETSKQEDNGSTP